MAWIGFIGAGPIHLWDTKVYHDAYSVAAVVDEKAHCSESVLD